MIENKKSAVETLLWRAILCSCNIFESAGAIIDPDGLRNYWLRLISTTRQKMMNPEFYSMMLKF
jgi:hypothetical protein